MNPRWDAAWDLINAEFSALAGSLRLSNPALWWSCGHADNETFPFWAYASFGRSGVLGEEDVVLSLSFKSQADGRLAFTSDIASGDGQIVAEGPAAQETADADRDIWVGAQISAGLAFAREHLETLRALL